MIDVLARLPVQLPEDPGLADREHGFLAAHVDEHALVHLVEIERFTGRMLVVPLQGAAVGIERERAARVQPAVERRIAAAGRHPRLRLRHAPIRDVELRIVAARDPGIAAGAEGVAHVAPGVAARPVAGGHRVEAPELVPILRVVGADEALLLAVARAVAQALHDLAADHERAARGAEIPFRAIADDRLPNDLTGAGVQRHEPCVARRREDLVVIDREAAHRGARRHERADAVLPDQLAAAGIERLEDVAHVVEIKNPSCTIGAGSFQPPSVIDHTHCNVSSRTLSRVIEASSL